MCHPINEATSVWWLSCSGASVKTFLGSTSAGVGQHSKQSIEIVSNGVLKKDLDGSKADTTGFLESFGCVLQAEGPGWDEDLNHEIGLNVSEPNGYEYYLQPPLSQPNRHSPRELRSKL